MPSVSIPVSGGLVNSKDASLLDAGELSKAEDCEYRIDNPAIWKVRGRAQANSSSESDLIKGIAYCEFDGAADKVILHENTVYRSATAAPGGMSFSDIVTGLTGGEFLESAYLTNKYYLFNGADRGRELSSDGSVIFHGMLRNNHAPTAAIGIGTITLSANATLTYWVEERVKDASGNIIKRNATTSANTVTITGPQANIAVVIYSGGRSDPEATHWALYGTATNGSFPIGAQIAEAVIAGPFLTDTRTGTDPGLPTGSAYELLSVSIEGVTVNTPRNDQPPTTPSTADFFEDSLVVNDASDLSKIWYSWPSTPHAFPAENFIDFPKSDEVKIIRRLGGVLIVLLRDSVWKVDFLPRPTDAEFSRGRVKYEVEGAHGAVGPKASALFSYGDGLRLAYISRYGLLTTNGYQWNSFSGDIDWKNSFNISKLSKAFLVNNSAEFRLEMYAPGPSSDTNNVCYFFHYHPSQIKDNGQAKITGPIHRTADCGELAHIGGIDYTFTAANQALYLNDTGNSDPLATIAMSVRTGDLYLGGPGNEVKILSLWAHHGAHTGQQATLTHISRNSGEDDASQAATIDLSRREPTITGWFGEGEAFQFQFDNSDTIGPVALNYFLANLDPQGDTGEG